MSITATGRLQEILHSVDALIRTHDKWEADPDPNSPIAPSAEFERAIYACNEAVQRGDIPKRCIQLANAIAELDMQWQLYLTGDARSDGTPRAAFWASYKAVVAARHVATPVPAKSPESVARLRAERVSDRQIACVIYGHEGEGPFLENGQIRFDLLEKEAAEPGSVLKGRYIHPLELARTQTDAEQVQTTLAAIDSSIVPDEPEPEPERKPAAQSETAPKPKKGQETKLKVEDESPTADQLSVDDMTDLVAKIRSNNKAIDAAGIVELLKSEHGQQVTVLQVADMLRTLRK